MIYALVFVSMLLADVAWTKYTLAVGEKLAAKAGFWSTLIVIFGAFNVTSYVHDWRTVIPAALGAFVGTWWAVWRASK